MLKRLTSATLILMLSGCGQGETKQAAPDTAPLRKQALSSTSIPKKDLPKILPVPEVKYLTVLTAPQPRRKFFQGNRRGAVLFDTPAFADDMEKVMRFDQRIRPEEYGAYVQPLHHGRVIARDGCVLIELRDKSLHFAILPPGLTLGKDSKNQPAYLTSGIMIARLGTQVTFSGGGRASSVNVANENVCGVTTSLYVPEIKSVTTS